MVGGGEHPKCIRDMWKSGSRLNLEGTGISWCRIVDGFRCSIFRLWHYEHRPSSHLSSHGGESWIKQRAGGRKGTRDPQDATQRTRWCPEAGRCPSKPRQSRHPCRHRRAIAMAWAMCQRILCRVHFSNQSPEFDGESSIQLPSACLGSASPSIW